MAKIYWQKLIILKLKYSLNLILFLIESLNNLFYQNFLKNKREGAKVQIQGDFFFLANFNSK